MSNKIDLTHKTIGKLFVVGKTELKKGHQILWACHCECRNFRLFTTHFLIKRGAADCGCEHISNIRKARVQHGYKGTKVYSVVDSVIRRCHDVNKDNYQYYGARGITVCDSWRNNRENFCEWLEKEGFREGLQVDRIDNDRGYSPDNCRLLPNSFNNINKKGYNTLGVCGVYFKEDCGIRPYLATVRLYNKAYDIGRYSKFEDAKMVREYVATNLCSKVSELCKEYALTPVDELKPKFVLILESLVSEAKLLTN